MRRIGVPLAALIWATGHAQTFTMRLGNDHAASTAGTGLFAPARGGAPSNGSREPIGGAASTITPDAARPESSSEPSPEAKPNLEAIALATLGTLSVAMGATVYTRRRRALR